MIGKLHARSYLFCSKSVTKSFPDFLFPLKTITTDGCISADVRVTEFTRSRAKSRTSRASTIDRYRASTLLLYLCFYCSLLHTALLSLRHHNLCIAARVSVESEIKNVKSLITSPGIGVNCGSVVKIWNDRAHLNSVEKIFHSDGNVEGWRRRRQDEDAETGLFWRPIFDDNYTHENEKSKRTKVEAISCLAYWLLIQTRRRRRFLIDRQVRVLQSTLPW